MYKRGQACWPTLTIVALQRQKQRQILQVQDRPRCHLENLSQTTTTITCKIIVTTTTKRPLGDREEIPLRLQGRGALMFCFYELTIVMAKEWLGFVWVLLYSHVETKNDLKIRKHWHRSLWGDFQAEGAATGRRKEKKNKEKWVWGGHWGRELVQWSTRECRKGSGMGHEQNLGNWYAQCSSHWDSTAKPLWRCSHQYCDSTGVKGESNGHIYHMLLTFQNLHMSFTFITTLWGLGYSSMVKDLPNMQKALGVTHSISKRKTNKTTTKYYEVSIVPH